MSTLPPSIDLSKSWFVRLLGKPEASRPSDGRYAHLRSQQTWGLLAALLLERQARPEEGWLLRETLMERFWPGGKAGRTSLRMSLTSLRIAFGTGCLECDKHRVRILHNDFRTDVEEIERLWERANGEADVEAIESLREAERRIGGSFLEGLEVDPGTVFGSAEGAWINMERARWNTRCGEVSLHLAALLERSGNELASFEAALRSVRRLPHNEGAWRTLRRLGRRLHRLPEAERLHEALSLSDALPRVVARERKQQPLTVKEDRRLRDMLTARLEALPVQTRTVFIALGVMRGPFRFAHAQQVSRARREDLLRFTEELLLTREGSKEDIQQCLFSMPEVVRSFAWGRLPEAMHNRLQRRQVSTCRRWLQARSRSAQGEGTEERGRFFFDPAQARPHIIQAVEWLKGRPESRDAYYFLQALFSAQLPEFREEGIALGELAHKNTRFLTSLERYSMVLQGAKMALADEQFERARRLIGRELQTIRESDLEIPLDVRGWLYFLMATACHHGERSDEAKQHIGEARRLFRSAQQPGGEIEAMLCEGEIRRALGEYTVALTLSEKALALCRTLDPPSVHMAACLHQRSLARHRIGDLQLALDDCREALSLRQEAGESNDIADCLRTLGAIRMDLANTESTGPAQQHGWTESRSHLEHAVRLYELKSNGGGRAATIGLLGDLFARRGQRQQAQECYTEALTYWEILGHQRWTGSVRDRMSKLEKTGAAGHQDG